MRSGNEIECIVMQESADSVVVRRGYGTVTIPRASIASVTKSAVLTEASIVASTQPAPGERVPAWNAILSALVKTPRATDVQQIPATVVDIGVMRHVPYQSYRCGADYEINIYGDPDHPAGIEIGIYRALLDDARAKQKCVEFIASVLTDKADAAILRALRQSKDSATRDGLTIEITPPTDPDAYGGWWVSVYNEIALDGARATEAELKQIAVARTALPAPAAAVDRPAVAPPPAVARKPVGVADAIDSWTPSDMARARPSSSSTIGGGSVYVRGYYRKNGTYVRPHTRRR
jgi:hypothetical protein